MSEEIQLALTKTLKRVSIELLEAQDKLKQINATTISGLKLLEEGSQGFNKPNKVDIGLIHGQLIRIEELSAVG